MAAYHVVWEYVVEQWLGVRRMLSNKRQGTKLPDDDLTRSKHVRVF